MLVRDIAWLVDIYCIEYTKMLFYSLLLYFL